MSRLYQVLWICLPVLLPVMVLAQDTLIKQLTFNKHYNDFAPISYGNGVCFISDRPAQFAINRVDANNQRLSRIYFTDEHNFNSPEIFINDLSPEINQGSVSFSPDGNTLVFTASVAADSRSSQTVLGLFFATRMGSTWSEPVPFIHNSANNSYSIAHPSMSSDGMRLYFSSDKPGGFGGRDIYYSEWINNQWSEPILLGKEINSAANEFFPSITSDNTLYFTSDRVASWGLDIYKSIIRESSITSAERLSAPINSEADDFAFTMNSNNISGYYSSNRNGRKDNIYSFQWQYPAFEHCPPHEEPSFCYYFEENNILPNDTMPLIFEWDMGDGTKLRSFTAEHCYQTFGTYHVALNVYDSLTQVLFAKVSEIDVVIEKSPFPYIRSLDSLPEAGSMNFEADLNSMQPMNVSHYYWDSGNGSRSRGASTSISFAQSGYFNVQLGVIGYNQDGMEEKRCATKRIKIGDVAIEDSIHPRVSNLQKDMQFIQDHVLTPKSDSSVYFVEFKQSTIQIPLTDQYFENIKYQITERYDESKTLYRYSVGETNNMTQLVAIYQDLMKQGYTESVVHELKTTNFKQQRTNQWWFLPDSISSSINRHINKFNDIQFDLGTYSIRPASFANLDYIAKVLIAEKKLQLLIHAHTDNLGDEDMNLQLSQKRAEAVIAYLVAAGVDSERLRAIGYGESKPIASNAMESGRAKNRRVEFEILF